MNIGGTSTHAPFYFRTMILVLLLYEIVKVVRIAKGRGWPWLVQQQAHSASDGLREVSNVVRDMYN
jgi:hypothetical protein